MGAFNDGFQDEKPNIGTDNQVTGLVDCANQQELNTIKLKTQLMLLAKLLNEERRQKLCLEEKAKDLNQRANEESYRANLLQSQMLNNLPLDLPIPTFQQQLGNEKLEPLPSLDELLIKTEGLDYELDSQLESKPKTKNNNKKLSVESYMKNKLGQKQLSKRSSTF